MHAPLRDLPRSSWITFWGCFFQLLPLHNLSDTFMFPGYLFFSPLGSENESFIYPALPCMGLKQKETEHKKQRCYFSHLLWVLAVPFPVPQMGARGHILEHSRHQWPFQFPAVPQLDWGLLEGKEVFDGNSNYLLFPPIYHFFLRVLVDDSCILSTFYSCI